MTAFLEGALSRAQAALNPRDFAVIFQAAQKSALPAKNAELIAGIEFVGPEEAPLVFVCAAPSPLEAARKRALVGDDAETFAKTYLAPLGLDRSEVAIGFLHPALPAEDLTVDVCKAAMGSTFGTELARFPRARLITLGKTARETLKEVCKEFVTLPHPSVVRRKSDSGEVARKLRSVAKALDVKVEYVQHATTRGTVSESVTPSQDTEQFGAKTCKVSKAQPEKQIVYGVVLDPYVVDLQGDWLSPATIEASAHGFLKKSRVIGLEHVTKADAQVVESWIEPYPSAQDYRAAMDGLPHKAFSKAFGSDLVHSGTWIAGVQVGDKEWALHKEGKLNSFSVGGFSLKSVVDSSEMPDVEFIELVEKPV